MPVEAKVKDEYRAGPVTAFSGHEYVRNEWRPVPAGFEPAALVHPWLDVREVGGKEIKVTAKDHLADALGTADLKVAEATGEPMEPVDGDTVTTEDVPVTTETVAEEESPAEKPEEPKRRRRTKSTDEGS